MPAVLLDALIGFSNILFFTFQLMKESIIPVIETPDEVALAVIPARRHENSGNVGLNTLLYWFGCERGFTGIGQTRERHIRNSVYRINGKQTAEYVQGRCYGS